MPIFAQVIEVDRTLLGPVFTVALHSGPVVLVLLIAVVRSGGLSIGAECGSRQFLDGRPCTLGRA